MAYKYRDFLSKYGAETGLSKHQFRLDKQSYGRGVRNYHSGQYTQPLATPDPGTGTIPNTTTPNPFEYWTGGKSLNIKNFLDQMNQLWSYFQANKGIYQGKINELFGNLKTSPAYQTLMDPKLAAQLTSPIMSSDMITSQVAGARGVAANEAAGLGRDLNLRAIASGQGMGATMPAAAGLAYTTGFKSQQMENDIRQQAAQMNATGLREGVGTLSNILQQAMGISAQELAALKDWAGSDQQFIDMIVTLLGGRLAYLSGNEA